MRWRPTVLMPFILPLIMSAASLQSAATTDPAVLVIPLAVANGATYVVDHRDERMLPDGTHAIFHQQHRLSFASDAGALIATYRVIGTRCEGPAPICGAFAQLTGTLSGADRRFGISVDGQVSMLDAAGRVPAIGQGEGAAQVADVVDAHERGAPGAIIAADLRQLLRFVAVPLPVSGVPHAVAEGRLSVVAVAAEQVTVTIQRASADNGAGDGAGHAAALVGDARCTISRATGLVQACRFTDWLGADRTRPLRVREVRVTLATGPVS